MLTYKTHFSTRTEDLFCQSLHKEFDSKIAIFNPDDIYEIILTNKPDFVVLHEHDLSHYHIQKFIKDQDNIKLSTTFIVLRFLNKKLPQIPYKRIHFIDESQYLPYNEYYSTTVRNDNFALCDLDCIEEKNNTILQPIIYPKNKEIPVKLVNCHKVGHIQNLGLVDEETILNLLSRCSIYINMNNSYVYDAMLMEKPILNLVDNKYLDKTIDTNIDHLKNTTLSYNLDINKYKISNIIKYIKSKYE